MKWNHSNIVLSAQFFMIICSLQAVMIAGGFGPDGATDIVLEYDIDSNSYNQIQSLPDPKTKTTMVIKNNYMYLFGGFNNKAVYRIELGLTEDWEVLDDMKNNGKEIMVIPYN